jgi:hypothetical protein
VKLNPIIREASVRRQAAFAMIAIILAVPAFAHHGAGTFELNKSVTFKDAKLTKVELLNPHGWLYFEVTRDGKVERHRCEMRSAHVLRRSGWTEDLLKPNQKMTVEASPDRADPRSCYLQTILFENGNRMDRYGQYVKNEKGAVQEIRGPLVAVANIKREARRPSGEPNITGDWAPEQRVMADPRGVGGGLVPLSQVPQAPPAPRGAAAGAAAGGAGRGAAPAAGGGGAGRGAAAGGGGAARGRGGVEFTEAGAAANKPLTQQDNPRFRCETTSIIFDWTFDGPVNRITQNRDNIVIQYGQMNLKRTIYMNMKTHPANTRPTRAGHSIGRWENDVLIVDTVGFLPGILTGNTRHTDKLHVVERFSLDPKTMTLTRAYTAEDPVHWKGQITGSDSVQPADAAYAEDRCKEQGFLDYSKQQGVK